MSKYVKIYVDQSLETPLHTTEIDGEDVPYLMFGNLDVDQKEKKIPLYLENQSTGIIEDLEITAQAVKDFSDPTGKRKGVTLVIEDGEVDVLPMMAVHKFTVFWMWGDDVKAGPLQALIDIKGVVANELV